MSNHHLVSEVNTALNDARVRVFRQIITLSDTAESMPVDCYVVVTQRFVLICDTLSGPEAMASLMQRLQPELGERQILVFNSHADWDHAWGNIFFTGEHTTPIIAHEHCRTRLQSSEAQDTLQKSQQRDPSFQAVKLLPPTLTFSDTLTIHGGDLTVRLFTAPGHCPDHCALWIPELRLLLAFDAVEHPIPSLDSERLESVPAQLATLEHFQALHPLHVFCSHSAASPTTITEQRAYLHEIVRHSQQKLAGRTTPTERELTIREVIAATASSLSEGGANSFYREAHARNVQSILRWVSETAHQG